MELTVKQENLSKALNIVSKVASSRTSLPILNNILLRTEGSMLLIAATNLEIAISQNIGAKITKHGAITVPARLVTEFISSLPKGNVSLVVDKNNLKIKSGNYSSTINAVAADDFPELPTVDETESIQYVFNTSEFREAVSQTVITASNDTSRPILTGVYWHSNEGGLYLASTDGYRLSERKLIDTSSELSAIIPTSSLQEVLRSINDSVDTIEVLFDEAQVKFGVGDIEIVSRLIDGKFIDYRQLIPKKTETNVELSKSEFARIVKISSLFARESGGSITLDADSDNSKLSIHSIASELGENTSEAEAKIEGSGKVTLNSRYLLEALGATQGDTVIFGFSGKLAPTIIKSASGDDNYIHIIMPLKS